MMKIDQGYVPNLSGCFNCIEGVSVVPSLVSRGSRRQVFVMSLLLASFGSNRSSETIGCFGLRARQIHKLVRSQLSMLIQIFKFMAYYICRHPNVHPSPVYSQKPLVVRPSREL